MHCLFAILRKICRSDAIVKNLISKFLDKPVPGFFFVPYLFRKLLQISFSWPWGNQLWVILQANKYNVSIRRFMRMLFILQMHAQTHHFFGEHFCSWNIFLVLVHVEQYFFWKKCAGSVTWSSLQLPEKPWNFLP